MLGVFLGTLATAGVDRLRGGMKQARRLVSRIPTILAGAGTGVLHVQILFKLGLAFLAAEAHRFAVDV